MAPTTEATEGAVVQVIRAARAYMQVKISGETLSGGLTMMSSQGSLTPESGKARLEGVVENIELNTLIDGLKALWRKKIANITPSSLLDYLRGIFDGLTDPKKKITMIQQSIRMLNEDQDENNKKVLDGSIRILIQEIDQIDSTAIPALMETLLDGVHGDFRHSLQLLPQLIARMDESETILTKICKLEWLAEGTMQYISILKDIPMTSSLQLAICEKIVLQSKVMDLETLPALVYQGLLFICKLDTLSLKAQALTRLIVALDEVESECNAVRSSQIRLAQRDVQAFRIAQATILTHFTFIIKQDHGIGQAYLREMKNNTLSGDFAVALLLAMGSIKQYETSVLKILTKHNEEFKPRLIAMLNTIQYDSIIPCMVKFAIHLITTSKNSEFGKDLLIQLYREYQAVQTHVLEHVLMMIISRSNATAYYIQVLDEITKTCTSEIGSEVDRIKSTLEYLSYLPQSLAAQLIEATRPLWPLKPQLKDHLVLILRKATFHHDAAPRCIAIEGLLAICTTPDLYEECRLLFRKCLTQQYAVRRCFYQRIVQVYTMNPVLREGIVDLLYIQLMKHSYHSNASVSMPFKFEDENEPLAFLLDCLFSCLRVESISKYADEMMILITRLERMEDEDNSYHVRMIGIFQVVMNHLLLQNPHADMSFYIEQLEKAEDKTKGLKTKKRKTTTGSASSSSSDPSTQHQNMLSGKAIVILFQHHVPEEKSFVATYLIHQCLQQTDLTELEPITPRLLQIYEEAKDTKLKCHALKLILSFVTKKHIACFFPDDGVSSRTDVMEYLTTKFQEQFVTASKQAGWKEAEIVLDILLLLSCDAKHQSWIRGCCETMTTLKQKSVSTRMISLYLRYSKKDCVGIKTMAYALQSYFNENVVHEFGIFTSDDIADAVVPILLKEMTEVMKNMAQDYRILNCLIQCWIPLLTIDSSTARAISFVRKLTILFRYVTNNCVRPFIKRTTVPTAIASVISTMTLELSPTALDFVANTTSRDAEHDFLKVIPDLVFQIEQLDVALIAWSKVCTTNREFKKWTRVRQARDFRLNLNNLNQPDREP